MGKFFLKLWTPVGRAGCKQVESERGICHFPGRPVIRFEPRPSGPSVEANLARIEFVDFSRSYESGHDSLVQWLNLWIDKKNRIRLERELIWGWSGQGAPPVHPWTELVDLGKDLAERYQVPFLHGPSRRTEFVYGCPD